MAKLLIGDILFKCPMSKDSKNMNDKQYEKDAEAYEISYINPGNQMIYLVTPVSARAMFSSPGDVGRLFVKSGHLITENVWWLS